MATNSTEVDCTASLIKGFTNLFNDKETSDVTLVVGNRRYDVHKNILAASSEVFHRMFYSGYGVWKESNTEEVHLRESPDCEDYFQTFLRYFYTGTMILTDESVMHLLSLTDKYDVEIKIKCVDYMNDVIGEGNIKTALQWVPICDQLGLTETLERCYELICSNFEKASEMPHWSTLSPYHLNSILERNDIIVGSEFDVYTVVQNWIRSQETNRAKTIKGLLSHVRFNNMTAVDLERVEDSPMVTEKRPNWLRRYLRNLLYSGFRHVALKTETKQKDITDEDEPQRFYIGCLQSVTFKTRCVTITPEFNGYWAGCTWNLKYSEKNGSLNFYISSPDVSNTVSTSNLYGDLPDTALVNFTIFLLNDKEILFTGKNSWQRRPRCHKLTVTHLLDSN